MAVREYQVENCIKLLEEGDSVPFISRYRKEKTGGLSDVEVLEVDHLWELFDKLEARKQTILSTIEAAGALTEELRGQIEQSLDPREIEDLYLPYRPKRRTRATAAREAGFEPLADKMYSITLSDPMKAAADFPDPEKALAGARDIIAERLAETASVRETLRGIFSTRRICAKTTKKASDDPAAQKYRSIFNLSEHISKIPAHRLLALLRASDEGYVSVSLDADAEKCCKKLYYDFCQESHYPSAPLAEQLHLAIEDAYKRLLEPSISSEVIASAKQKADLESVKLFGENLRQLLLASPVGSKRTLALDPGFRTGCKVVCLGAEGNLLCHDVIYPHPPQNEKVKSIQKLSELIGKYSIEVIAIGNGTAGRETEEFVKRVPKPENCRVYSVSEDGASIYSASEVGREEFPEYDVTVRGAVSIGRRLMDPLAELVKIDPKSLGVGQYQHDVDQNLLRARLDETVESCVNLVGVNLNTASPYLLQYVSGIGPSLANSIVEYRTANGAYTSRAELLKVKRLGAKAYEQCAGFLRIPGARNPLDNSAVHPEAYPIVEKMASSLGVEVSELVGNAELCSKLKAQDFVTEDFGLPTINDILKELPKPGRDPREAASEFAFSDDVHNIDDLKVGMELPGIVTNLTAFGAFVDIGVHDNGLIHASNMGVKGMAVPSKVLRLHQHVLVSVMSVDLDRGRIGLRLVKTL